MTDHEEDKTWLMSILLLILGPKGPDDGAEDVVSGATSAVRARCGERLLSLVACDAGLLPSHIIITKVYIVLLV